MIDFARPEYFGLSLVVLAIAGIVYYTGYWRRRARSEFAGPQAGRWGGSGFWVRSALIVAAAALIVVAAARPQWGTTETFRELEGIDYVIALDVSRSMHAEDVPPTRLAAAQEALVRLVESDRGSRIGLVIFAGTAFMRSPLTSDTQAMAQLIQRAGAEASLVRAGSDLGAALDMAGIILAASEPGRGRAVILVSDGEDFAATYAEKAQSLQSRDITVLTAGVGTPGGAPLFDENFQGERVPRLDDAGLPIVSRLDESSLRQIAEIGGGIYQPVIDDRSLINLRIDLRGLDPTPVGTERNVIPIERYQYFVAVAIGLILVAWFLPARLPLPRLRLRRAPAFAALLLALFIGACGDGDQGEDADLVARNDEANQLYAAGDFQGAVDIYQALVTERPDVDEITYNLGNALHRLQEFERAIDATRRGLPPRDPVLGVMSYYALGNHYLMLGRLEEAYIAYRQALLLDPDDGDAKHNLELVLRLAASDQGAGDQQLPGLGQGEPLEDATPQPGDQPGPSGEPQPGSSPQAGTPQPGGSEGSGDLPPATPSGTPSGTGSLERTLAEALAGIDEEVTFQQALEILELLRQRQESPRPLPGGSTGPDY